MTDRIAVSVELLRRASNVLLSHLEEVEGGIVVLDKDYFWAIDPAQTYNVFEDPSELTIGQLTESLANLEEAVVDGSSVVSYGLVWLADVLAAVGRTVVR